MKIIQGTSRHQMQFSFADESPPRNLKLLLVGKWEGLIMLNKGTLLQLQGSGLHANESTAAAQDF